MSGDADHKCFECGTDLTVVCLRCNPLKEAPPPPAGDMVLVPREITLEMQHAYFRVIDDNMGRVQTSPTFGRYESQKQAYRAMLAAAPLPARAESALRPGKTVR